MNSVTYIVPSSDFFSNGRGGAVSHAIGIVAGLAALGYRVNMIAEPNAELYVNSMHEVDFSPVASPAKRGVLGRIRFARDTILRTKDSSECFVLLRKNIYFILACLLYSDVRSVVSKKVLIWEVNGLSYDRASSNPAVIIYAFSANALNKLVMNRFGNKIYVVSEMLRSQLLSGLFPVCKTKIIVVPNGGPSWLGNNVKDTKNIQFLFFGKYQAYNDYELVINAFRSVKARHANSSLLFYGFGPHEEKIQQLARGAEGVSVNGPASITELVKQGVIGSRSVGLVPLIDDPSVKVLSPIKFLEYVSAGMPVIFADIADFGRDATLFRTVSVPYVVGDERSLIAAMDSFFEDNFSWQNSKEHCFHISKTCSWESRMRYLVDNIFSTTTNNG